MKHAQQAHPTEELERNLIKRLDRQEVCHTDGNARHSGAE